MFLTFNSTNSINGSNNPSGPSLVESSYIRDNHSEVLLRAAGRRADVGQQARKPPSTGRVTPLIMLLFSLSRNKMLFTTSSTSAHRHTHHTQLYRANPDTTCAAQRAGLSLSLCPEPSSCKLISLCGLVTCLWVTLLSH